MEIANASYIKNELKKFNLTDQAIVDLEERYLPLKIKGTDDKEGYSLVRSARLDIKNKRIEVEKRRADLNRDAIKFQRAINTEAKRIRAKLIPIESYLGKQEESYEAEQERLKKEKERAEQEKLQVRINSLQNAGMKFNGALYISISLINPGAPIYQIDPYSIKSMNDQQFEDYLKRCLIRDAENKKHLEAERLKAAEEAERIEKERKAEAERLEKQRTEQAAESARLAALAQEQNEREAAIVAAQKQLEDEKKALEAQKIAVEPIKIAAAPPEVTQAVYAAAPAPDLTPPQQEKQSSGEICIAHELEKDFFDTDIRDRKSIEPVNIFLLNNRWYVRSWTEESVEGNPNYAEIDLLDTLSWVKKFKPELLEVKNESQRLGW